MKHTSLQKISGCYETEQMPCEGNTWTGGIINNRFRVCLSFDNDNSNTDNDNVNDNSNHNNNNVNNDNINDYINNNINDNNVVISVMIDFFISWAKAFLACCCGWNW